jgi:hypothetical protein
MRNWKRIVGGLWACAGLTALATCGDSAVQEGGFCNATGDCATGLVCENNTCVKPQTSDCVPPCGIREVCIDRVCRPIDLGPDKDGDGFPVTIDCDDLDPFTHPADDLEGIPGGHEFCDGKDNDCDGLTDEGCWPCEEGTFQSCGSDLGVCTQGTQSCTAGLWGPCSGRGPSEELPDGLDNDCDGVTDEGMPCQAGAARACLGSIGACQPGQQRCLETGSWSDCENGVPPTPEACDGLDNDCDGLTDEGFMLTQRCTGRGVCGAGVIECANGLLTRCSTEPGGSQDQSGAEVCDGLDNDCDGLIDEDFLCGGAVVGQTCVGLGACGAGTCECMGANAALCSSMPGGSQSQARTEICDRVDNDCDGLTDEDFLTGTPCDGEGECGAGVIECGGTATTRCSTDPSGSQSQAQPEVCDGLDNDCDGLTDEDFQVGDACDGVGECPIGRIECLTLASTVCSTDRQGSQYQLVPEVCDGLDNDCDGQPDNGLHEDLCAPFPANVVLGTCVQGACRVNDPVTGCAEGYWDLDGVWGTGCEFMLDGGPGNVWPNDCAQAHRLPEVRDHPAMGETVVTGNLVPADDVDWFIIRAVDVVDLDELTDNQDNFRIRVQLGQPGNPTIPPPGVRMDVKVNTCTDTSCTGDTLFEWGTDGSIRPSAPGSLWSQENQCRPTNTNGYNICSDNSREIIVQVYAVAGQGYTSQTYQLRITNGS